MAGQKASQPFRFLDLPTEIRLMIYERLPRGFEHTHVYQHGIPPHNAARDSPDGYVILITKSLPLAILGTNRTVYGEAKPIVDKLVREFVLGSRPKVIEADHVTRHALFCVQMGLTKEFEAIQVNDRGMNHILKGRLTRPEQS